MTVDAKKAQNITIRGAYRNRNLRSFEESPFDATSFIASTKTRAPIPIAQQVMTTLNDIAVVDERLDPPEVNVDISVITLEVTRFSYKRFAIE